MNNISNENLYTLFANAESFAILTHKRPDGDAISSSLAIFWYLIDIGKKPSNIDILIPYFNKDFSFINGVEYFRSEPTKDKYNLVIVVDCSEEQRIENSYILKNGEKTICFDHHDSPSIKTDYGIIDAKASSCTAVIYKKISCTNVNFLNCIAIGIISDTCNLKLNVTEDASAILKNLTLLGIDVNCCIEQLESPNSRTQELSNIALRRGIYKKSHNHTIFCTYLLQSDFLTSEKNLKGINHKAIINEISKIANYTTLILFFENDVKQIKGSLRTSSSVDLNEICLKFIQEGKFIKGGGHFYSSGCTISVLNKDAKKCILEMFEEISNAIFSK